MECTVHVCAALRLCDNSKVGFKNDRNKIFKTIIIAYSRRGVKLASGGCVGKVLTKFRSRGNETIN